MKKLLISGLVLLSVAVIGLAVQASVNREEKEGKGEKMRVFEMRTYYAKPGKMKALHARFRDHTCKLFEKHGITMIGFWSPTDEKMAETKMIYLLAYPSKEAADKSWAAFRDDPEWKKAQQASEKDGALVEKVESIYMNPTDYSTMK